MKQELGNLMAEDPHQETINLLNYRLNAVTVERDEWKAKFIQQNKDLGCEMMDPNGTIWDHAKKLQGDLAAVTEQLTTAREELADFKKHIDVQNKLINTLQSKKVKFKEQRDRLAEALERIGEEDGSPMSMRVCSTKSLVKQALQSLNPDHTVAANDMIAAVKKWSDE